MSATTVLLATLLTYTVASPLPQTTRHEDVDNYRLPKSFIPERYDLHITPNYPTEAPLVNIQSFEGIVRIRGQIKVTEDEREVDKIVLHHSKEINIGDICVEDYDEDSQGNKQDGEICNNSKKMLEIDEEATSYDNTTQKFTITLKNSITANKNIIVSIQYNSTFENRLTGFYKSTYDYLSDGKSNKAGLLATKFEPTHAREAFPCLDEPSLKAKFKLQIDIQEGINAIANTEAIPEESKKDQLVSFELSPKMTTYLLAFIVYEKNSFGSTGDNQQPQAGRDETEVELKHNTWGRKSAIEDGDGELSDRDGPRMIDFMDEYTGIHYTGFLPKMDQVALPEFQSGAMENWGLVTYRENALLYNEDTGTTAAHKRVSDVLAHEIVHQWFGNLVVTNWWDSVWLNEGFANYFELLIMDHLYDSWRMHERFVLDEQMSVFSLDSSADAVPLTKYDVFSPGQIANHFGSTSYSKGGAILRQISNVMGESEFQEACVEYLQTYANESATADQLLEMFVNHNNKSLSGLDDTELKKALESWTLRKGYPVIKVERESTNQFKITQERFLQTKDTEADETPLYYVPLTWVISNDSVPTGPEAPQNWLTERQASRQITINEIDDNQWIIFNSWQSGYYRVNYDDAMWDMIVNALNSDPNAIAPVDRAGIIDNLLNLARAEHVSYERALRGIEFLKNDHDFIPWAAARSALSHLDRMLSRDADYKGFIRSLVDSVYNELDWKKVAAISKFEEPNVNLTHRINIFSIACASGLTDCMTNAENMLKGNLADIDNELQSVVYCYGLKNDEGGELWDKLWNEWVAANNNAARRGLLTTALGCSNNETILKTYLGYSLDSTIVRSQDAYTVFTAVYSNPDGVNVALDFLEEKSYETLENAYGSVRNVMSTIISGLANRLTTKEQKDKLTKALGDKSDTHATAIKTVDGNILWTEKFLNEVKAVTGGAQANVIATSLFLICAAVITFLR